MWFGAALCLLLLAAPAAFTASPTATVAANVVGAMLTRWHYVAIAAPLLLLLLPKGGGKPPHSILVIAIVIAAAQAITDVRIRAIRISSPAPISSLAPSDPVRRRFGLLHGASSVLLLAEAVAAGIVVSRD